MELWLLLGALWLVECLVLFPPGAASLAFDVRGEPRLRSRTGLALAAPWPVAFSAVLDGIPFELTRKLVSARGSLSLLSASSGMHEERTLPLDALAPESAGARVRTRAGPLLRASSDVAAARLAGWLGALERLPEAERSDAFVALWRRALDPTTVAAAVAVARSWSGVHRVLAGATLAGSLVGVPALAIATGAGFDAAWDLGWPVFAALHGATFAALVGSEWRLRAPGRGMRLFRASLYPPALWRASFEQASALLGVHHPLAVAAALARPPEQLRLARRALAECAWPAFERRGDSTAPDLEERRAALRERATLIEALFVGAGIPAERLAEAPAPSAPHAASYCPVCQSEFVVGGWSCPECGVETRPF